MSGSLGVYFQEDGLKHFFHVESAPTAPAQCHVVTQCWAGLARSAAEARSLAQGSVAPNASIVRVYAAN